MPTQSIELVTVPNVELLEVGTWETSTGVFTWTLDDLQAAVAAQDDPGYHTPTLKLGHVDPRFDGEPAVGRVENLRLSDDKQTLIGDYVAVPAWLADALPSAYPDRSIEGQFQLVTATGTTHRFGITAVALLGTVEPAISTLEDVARFLTQGVAASTPPVCVSLRRHGGHLVPPSTVQAAVSIDELRSAFYEAVAGTSNPWAWIRECWVGDGAFLIVDDDEGNLFRVPWSESNGTISFATPERVAISYVPAPAPEEEQQSGLVLMARNVPLSPEVATMTPEQLAELGLEPDATPEQIIERMSELGALAAAERDAARAALDEHETTVPPPPESTADLPEGFVAVPQSTLDTLVSASGRVESLERDRHQRERSAFLSRYERKFAPAQRADMERVYDTSGADVLASMLDKAPDIVPVHELGHEGEGQLTDDDAVYAALFGSEAK